MTARQIEDAAARLREFRMHAYEDLGLAGLAFALALAASQIRPALALPLLAGALAMNVLGLRALVRGWFLVEDLAVEPEARDLPEVRRFCLRAASPRRRRELGAQLRAAAAETGARNDLLEVAAILEDERFPLDPQAAVLLERRATECLHLLQDPSAPEAEVRARVGSLRRLIESHP